MDNNPWDLSKADDIDFEAEHRLKGFKNMSTLSDRNPAKKSKLLACARCRHRKKKCTELRPCENCIQSGSACIPGKPLGRKPPEDPEYVRSLEERVAHLESLIPHESLDHADTRQPPTPTLPDQQDESQSSNPFENAGQRYPSPAGSTGQYQAADAALPMHFPEMPSDNVGSSLLGALSSTCRQSMTLIEASSAADVPELDSISQQFLIQTYFKMAHSQYPFLLKHQLLEWAESWNNSGENVPLCMRWKGFFIYMVYAIAFLMTKTRINGPTRSQAFYDLAASRYLPYLVRNPCPLVRAQGFLLLTVYALHMPSHDSIISMSSWSIRFCIRAQLHLAETEPQPFNNDAFIRIQHRRRVFWCAYAIDRAVCSSFDFPFSIPDNHLTISIFDDIDDNQLLAAANLSQNQGSTQVVGTKSPTSVSSALHVIMGRRIVSEIQETTISREFVPHSADAFLWRAQIAKKLKDWDSRGIASTEPSDSGYVSATWQRMIYYYNIINLYRPTRVMAQGLAGDCCVQACCHALLLFRELQMAREIAQPWLGLLSQFKIGVTLLYCFYGTPIAQWKPSYKSADVPDAIRACSSTLAILAERWAEAECVRDIFEILAKEIPFGEGWERPSRIRESARAEIDKIWDKARTFIIHPPTLRMIQEMATEDFVNDVDIPLDEMIFGVALSELIIPPIDETELRWIDPALISSFEMGALSY